MQEALRADVTARTHADEVRAGRLSGLIRVATGCVAVLGLILAGGPAAGAWGVAHAGSPTRVAAADGSNPECLGNNCGAPHQEGG